MFDMSSFELHNSIANAARKRLLESQKLDAENKARIMQESINALVSEYDRTYNTPAVKVLNRKILAEQATIHAVKGAMYDLFESALLLDEAVKIEYGDSLRAIFESYFIETLKENNVKSLTQFKTFISKSHSMLTECVQRAERLVNMNEAVYDVFLENVYNTTSIDNMLIETYEYLSEAYNSPEEKVSKIKAMVDEVVKNIQSAATSDKLIPLSITFVRVLGLLTKKGYRSVQGISGVIDRILAGVARLFGKQIVASLKKEHETGTKNIMSTFIRSTKEALNHLNKLKKQADPGSPQMKSIESKITLVFNTLQELNEYKKSMTSAKETDKPLQECDYTEFLMEADSAIMIPSKQGSIIQGLQEKMTANARYLDPKQALEDLRLSNRIMSDPGYHKSIKGHNGLISHSVLSVVRALKDESISDAIKDQIAKEAGTLSNNLDTIIKNARSDKDPSQATIIIRQKKRLDAFLNQFKLNGNKFKRLMRESNEVYGTVITESIKDMTGGNILEAAQFILMYETTAEDIKQLAEAVDDDTENNDKESKEHENDNDDSDDENASVESDNDDELRSAMDDDDSDDEELKESFFKLEAALLRRQLNMIPKGLMSEAAADQLKKGSYPKYDDFLDKDDKNLLAAIISAAGKNDAVNVIKAKVMDVIESEEKRIEELEQKENEMIEKLSSKFPKGSPELQEAVSAGIGGLNLPKNLFEAIVMNRSKKYIEEAAHMQTGFDIMSKKDVLMAESIALYTIHETFNTLRFGTYDGAKIQKLSLDYYRNKI